jgi:malonyl CoA-acyl carrier protein transacylase
MQPASISFGEFLNKIDFDVPHIPIIQNFDAVHHDDLYKIINSLTVVKGNKLVKKGASLEEQAEARAQLIDKTKQALVNQLFNPVRWTETIKFMASKGVGCFIEVGPGKVLTGLNRRIIERASHVSVSNEEAIREISQFRRVPND